MDKLNWSKCPSVTPGGKPYFYVAFTDKGKITVMWDRVKLQWMAIGDMIRNGEVYGLFPTSSKAIQYVESTI